MVPVTGSMNMNMRIYLVGVAWPSSRGLRVTILNIHAIGNDVLYIFNAGVSQIQLWSASRKTGWGCHWTPPLLLWLIKIRGALTCTLNLSKGCEKFLVLKVDREWVKGYENTGGEI